MVEIKLRLKGADVMDYRQAACQILEKSGGRENIISAAHCATRLRIAVHNKSKCNMGELEMIEGVKGAFFASGQLQIIIGTGTVDKVYDEFIRAAGVSTSSKEDVKRAAAAGSNILIRAVKVLGDIFMPIIPAIVASGFLMGIMEALEFMVQNHFLNISTQSSIYVFSTIFANAAYTFLPILIAYSAGKIFGANPYLAAVIGMIMIHPSLQNAWSVAAEGILKTQTVFFGLYKVNMVGYQGHVIPVIIAVWLLALIEKRLHRIVPAMIDLFVTPLVSVFITGYLTLAVIGPVFVTVENGIMIGIQKLLSLPFGVGSLIVGALYAVTVVLGIHHMYTVIDIGQLSGFGVTYWLPLASAANMAQGAAALAVGIKTKDKKLKSMALPSSFSAFMGITEPAIFGVNLRYLKPFVCACIGGGCGAMYASIVGLGATGTGITGIFAILLHLHSPMHYVIAMLIASGVSFALTWFFGYKNEDVQVSRIDIPMMTEKITGNHANVLKNDGDSDIQSTAVKANADDVHIVYAPVSGRVVKLSELSDQTFASEVLGKGAAIIPEDGRMTAPVDGKVAMLFPTKHAIGITTGDGVELLVHIGLNTVELEGKYLTAHVNTGDVIRKGQLLMEFDIEAIKAAGYEVVTPVIITNSDEYEHMEIMNEGHVKSIEEFLKVYS